MKRDYSLSYYTKNISPLLLMALMPSLFLMFFTKNDTIADFFIVFAGDIRGFKIEKMYDVYKYFSLINFNLPTIWVFAVVVAVIFAGLIFSAIERHMRLRADLGIKISALWRDSFSVIAIYALLNLGLAEVCALCVTGMILIFNTFAHGTVFLFLVSLFITVIIYVFFSIIFTFLSVTVPSLLIDGYSFRFAASYSVNLVQKNFKFVYWRIMIPFLFSAAVFVVSKIILDASFGAIGFILSFGAIKLLFYCFWLSYLPVLCINNYFFLTNAKRDIFGRLK